MTNAAKHGRADKAIVYAEPGDDTGVFVSVKDNGVGFDPATVQQGQGLNGSIAARISDAGGRVEIDGRPGRGAEIRMWL
ncbi:MAG: ATP-binding protein [Acidimicrobiales bacterium]